MPIHNDLAQRLDAAAGPAPDVEEGLASLRARLAGRPPGQRAEGNRWLRPVLVAAASLIFVGGAVAMSIGRNGPATSVHTDGENAVASEPPNCHGPPGSATDLTGQPDWEGYNVRPWTDASGCLVRVDVLVDAPGAEHCGNEDADFLAMAVNLGQRYRDPGEQEVNFVRDPKGVYELPAVTAAFEPDATLPESAVDTGYRRDGIKLHTDPANPNAVWLAYPDGHVELWPQAELPPCR